MRTSPFAWRDACLLFSTRNFVCRLPKPGTRIFLTVEPLHVKRATTFKDVPFAQMEELAALRAKNLSWIGRRRPLSPWKTENHVWLP